MIGGVQADHRVRQARPAGDHQHPGPAAAHPPVGGGHERRAAFVPADDQAHAVVVGQCVGHAEVRLAGHAIDQIDIVRFEAVHQQAGDGLGHCLGFLGWYRLGPKVAGLRALGKVASAPPVILGRRPEDPIVHRLRFGEEEI